MRSGSLSEDELSTALPGGVTCSASAPTPRSRRGCSTRPPTCWRSACFCIGTNQVDLAAAAERGIAVFNAPFSNTRSVVELVHRRDHRAGAPADRRRRSGCTTASGTSRPKGSHEVRGRTLGIVGYGNIGTQLSNAGRGPGHAGDLLRHRRPAGPRQRPPGAAPSTSCSSSPTSSRLHVDGRPGNAGLFGADQFAPDEAAAALFINASRGMVVDDVALRENIQSGHIAGAAIDVFPIEPKAPGRRVRVARCAACDNVILTPHVGGSTQEAQEEIGYFVAGKLAGVRRGGQHRALGQPARGPAAAAARGRSGSRYLHLNVPGVLAERQPVLADTGANVTGPVPRPPAANRGTSSPTRARRLPDAALEELRSAARRSGCALPA